MGKKWKLAICTPNFLQRGKSRIHCSRKSYITLLIVVVVVVVVVVVNLVGVVDCSIVIEKFKTVTKITVCHTFRLIVFLLLNKIFPSVF